MSAGPLIRLDTMFFDVQRFVRCSVVPTSTAADAVPGFYLTLILHGDHHPQVIPFDTPDDRAQFNEGLYAAVSTAMAITRGVDPAALPAESFGHDEGGDDLPRSDASDEIPTPSSKGDQP